MRSTQAATTPPAEAMEPQVLRDLGLFLLVQRERSKMSELEARHYIGQAAAGHEALTWAQETRAAMVDLKFCDLLGTWQHVSLPIGGLDEAAFEEGLGFDGSSIRGWQGISESDNILIPHPARQRPPLRPPP